MKRQKFKLVAGQPMSGLGLRSEMGTGRRHSETRVLASWLLGILGILGFSDAVAARRACCGPCREVRGDWTTSKATPKRFAKLDKVSSERLSGRASNELLCLSVGVCLVPLGGCELGCSASGLKCTVISQPTPDLSTGARVDIGISVG